MLRTTFDNADRNGHIEDHLSLHNDHNSSIHVDDETDIATALIKAEQYKVPRVILNPTSVYSISNTLVIPPEVELDGGGRGLTSNAGTSTQNRARINADAPLLSMINLSHFSSIRGCNISGEFVASGGIFGQDVIGNFIKDNLISRMVDYGLRFGGCLFTTIKNNGFNQIRGYGLDALRSYGNTGYYGINVGLSERNEWKGEKGHIRIEGILTSVSDDFEGVATNDAFVTVGGTVQSHLAMYHPYFEMKSGTRPIKAIRVEADSHLSVNCVQAIGSVSDANSVFIECNNSVQLAVTDSIIKRFATVFSGSLRPAASVHVVGNVYSNYNTINGFSNLANVSSALCMWPDGNVLI